MWRARSRFASSINGRFSVSVNSFHSAPSRLEISELCILGFSWAIFRRWPRDQTMKAFIGRFTRFGSLLSSSTPLPPPPPPMPLMLLLWGGVGDGPSSPPSSDVLERVGDDLGSWVLWCRPWWDL